MQFKKSELTAIGKAYDIVEISFIVLSKDLRIEYANKYIINLLQWDNENKWINLPLSEMCQSLNIPNLVTEEGAASPKSSLIRNYVKQWKLTPVLIDSKEGFFLSDQDITEKEKTHEILRVAVKDITGQPLVNNLSIKQYIDELHNWFKSIIFNVPGYIYIKDRNFRYIFCNDALAASLGFNSPQEVVGKTDYDFGWDKNLVDKYRKVDEEIISTGMPKLGIEETVYTQKGRTLQLLVNKTLIFNKSDEIIGIIGVNIDISDRKEAETLKIKNEASEITIKEQEKFRKIVDQVAHDIRSPLVSLDVAVQNAAGNLPEEQRMVLRSSAIRIHDIANNLLNHYKPNHEEATTEKLPLLLSTNLLQLLAGKKYEYSHLPIQFDHDFGSNSQFAFIKVEAAAFERMVSNLINNAVDALEGNPGKITLKLEATDKLVKVKIQDNGKGMPETIVTKIMNNIAVTSGKNDGHGIGLTQVRETLQNNQGEFAIDSAVGKGTTIILTFLRIAAPSWIAEEITLKPDDKVVILDDDVSIHGAWDLHFEPTLKNNPQIKVQHYSQGAEAVADINRLSDAEKDKLFLLTDYELLHQNLNGLEVIAQTQVKRAVLVTSHYANPQVREKAAQLNTRILPKLLAATIPLTISSPEATTRNVDVVFIDDDKSFVDLIAAMAPENKIVDKYYDPDKFLRNLAQYPKNTKICMDNNFGDGYLGMTLAQELQQQGYTNLYMLSGQTFTPEQIPDYLTVIMKMDSGEIRNLFN